ncbi:Plant transposon protein [Fragilaria crotonensis]|nr:Plant transposon protein [Fragilaria crotonensis]
MPMIDVSLLDGHNDHDNYSTDDSTFGNFWHSQYFVSDDEEDEAPAPPPPTSPVRKKKRTSYARKPQSESTWSRDYLIPTLRESYIIKPHGRDAKKFRRLFRVPYDLFVVLVGLCKERWWTDWTPEKVDAAGKLVSNLELKVLGALYVLGTGASQHQVGVQTNISEEVHRCFFLAWISKMSSIQKEYIFMPTNDEQFERVVGEYSTRGLPGCVGSVDCVHVGWDKCPSMYKHMYTGKEGFPSIAYEVICTARKFIQSVSVGHPGSRNDKHIVRTDDSVMQLLEGNGWLQSKAWKAAGPDGRRVSFFGVYLICDGGYHHWPCLISPVKAGTPGSAVMQWSQKVESVRKDIEGVFGILKSRFKFLKNFNSLKHHSAIDNAFVTCCILHNMLLETDGWLDPNLPPLPGGVEERLSKKFGNIYANNTWNGTAGIWNRVEDDTVDEEMNRENQRHHQSNLTKKEAWAISWAKVTAALVDHHQFGTVQHMDNNILN